MKKTMIFGKPVTIVIKKSNRDFVRLRKNKLFVYFHKKPAELLVKDFLSNMLYAELYKIYEKVRKTGRIRIIGDLDFDIVDEIDNKIERTRELKNLLIDFYKILKEIEEETELFLRNVIEEAGSRWFSRLTGNEYKDRKSVV